MQHDINTGDFGPFGERMAEEISRCVHCGFCLSACPTYELLGQEMDSPRGRILLMKEVLEGTSDIEQVRPHIDQCLGCLACEPACPSGVHYRDILTPFRALHQEAKPSLQDKLISSTLPYPAKFKRAVRMSKLAAPFKPLLPADLKNMLDRTPGHLPAADPLPERLPAEGEQRGKVALLTGCVQRVLAPEINRASAELLAAQGIDVFIPSEQSCCGSLDWHQGRRKAAQQHLQQLMAQMPGDVDAIISNAAGCGSSIAEAETIFAGSEHEAAGRAFAAKTVDISRYLAGLGLRDMRGPEQPQRVAIQDACHLLNGQGVSAEPRALLHAIPNVEVVELASSGCCGSAGTYNIEHPTLAAKLGKKKAREICDAQVDVVVSGNIGCLMQIQPYLEELNGPEIMHLANFLVNATSRTIE